MDVAASIGSEAQLALGQIRGQLDTIRDLLAQAVAGTLADPAAAQGIDVRTGFGRQVNAQFGGRSGTAGA